MLVVHLELKVQQESKEMLDDQVPEGELEPPDLLVQLALPEIEDLQEPQVSAVPKETKERLAETDAMALRDLGLLELLEGLELLVQLDLLDFGVRMVQQVALVRQAV